MAAWLSGVAVAAAQQPPAAPLTRADVDFVFGWQNLEQIQPSGSLSRDNWINEIFCGGAGAGVYWTDHVKTQVDVGVSTHGVQHRYGPTVIDGQSTTTSSRLDVRRQSLAVSQQYQFFRNQWIHPHVAAGVEIARETTTVAYDPIYVFDTTSRVSKQAVLAHTDGPTHRLIARPFAEAGFKAYMTRRAFFTGEMRVGVWHGLDDLLFRGGFGIDF